MHILFTLGLIMALGLAGGRLFERFGIPQVVGYIVVGVVLGDSVLHFISLKTLDDLSPLTSMALAFIGFMVGGELKYSIFQKYGRQFFSILLSEGLLAMLLVCTLTILLTKNIPLGILLGALSSATAPAATVDVLWEYRSKGPLTSTILAIVALDDGLALFLYGFAFSFANALVTGGGLNIRIMVLQPLIEIFGSLLLGFLISLIIDHVLRWIKTRDDQLVINVAAILLASGIAKHFDLSLILTNMAVGLTLTNLHPDRNESNFEVVKKFVPPIYIIFFLFVGARLQLGLLPSMGILGVLYVLGRTIGKWAGSFLGATISGAPLTVRKYLGFALFSQAGVAIGLALDIYQHFGEFGSAGERLGHTVINVIAATTLLVQIIGPLSVKFAISKAGEIPEQIQNKSEGE
ncbi:MAG: cation:proton antiporter [Desulfobacter sp.]|uniref:cation:proton antiporter n=1 Tax=uncultured Desulfobacter sp. TaxID=240139 RepID=UPI0029C941D1|nr:cation:proton antiporter [uncultured Desulfobacter sp.]MCW8800104.1 cation:proton antiporter [Desulfobacter sp.]